MKRKRSPPGFIQIPLLLMIVISLVVVSGIGAGVALRTQEDSPPRLDPPINAKQPLPRDTDPTSLQNEKPIEQADSVSPTSEPPNDPSRNEPTPPTDPGAQRADEERRLEEERRQHAEAEARQKEEEARHRQEELQRQAQAKTAEEQVKTFYRQVASAVTHHQRTLGEVTEELLTCIERGSAQAIANYDAAIQQTQTEIDNFKWHLANLCDMPSSCPSDKYSAEDIPYLESRISSLEYWKAVDIGNKLQAHIEASRACGVVGVSSTRSPLQAVSESLQQQTLQYRMSSPSSSNYESYSIRANGVGGYNVVNSRFQTWTVSPNSVGGYTIADPTFRTWQARINGVGGYDVNPLQ